MFLDTLEKLLGACWQAICKFWGVKVANVEKWNVMIICIYTYMYYIDIHIRAGRGQHTIISYQGKCRLQVGCENIFWEWHQF